MVKQRKKNNRKKQSSKGFTANSAKARKINASTEYETCDEQLSPFGGLLAEGMRVGIEMRRAQPIGREFPTRTLSVCAAGS